MSNIRAAVSPREIISVRSPREQPQDVVVALCASCSIVSVERGIVNERIYTNNLYTCDLALIHGSGKTRYWLRS